MLTRPIGAVVPARWRSGALVAIRAFHTAVFASVLAALLLALWDGVRGRPARRTLVAGGVVIAETAVYLSNNQVCPLTPLAEELGADRGSVVDLFLPASVARRIPIVSGIAALLALALNLRAVRRRVASGRASEDDRLLEPGRTALGPRVSFGERCA